MDAARNTFHRIHKTSGQSDIVDSILKQLDFHPLSVTLLATVAQQSKWGNDRLAREWKERHTSVLHAQHKSLEATIRLSLSSPTFRGLGPDAQDLLGVIAFFPQGVNEENFGWLFPSISNGNLILDKFCTLSLTYRNDGFITMLAPLRDYLRPNGPKLSPLLCMTKEHYIARVSAKVDPQSPGFEDTRWITSEDANVEHLLNVLISIGADSDDIWGACNGFIEHLCWHKPRLTVLGSRIETLPDDHRSKPECLFLLSRLFNAIGNQTERKRLLSHCLELEREWGDDGRVAGVLRALSDANWLLDFFEEGIRQSKDALKIYERLGDIAGQAQCFIDLGKLFKDSGRVEEAEEAVSRAITLLPEKDQEYQQCQAHSFLGEISFTKGDTEKGIHHLETAIGIASPLGWDEELFWNHQRLAMLLSEENKFDDAQAHIDQAKSHAARNLFFQGCAAAMQAGIWFREGRLEEAMSEALRALVIHEKVGAVRDAESCRELIQVIERRAKSRSILPVPDSNGELPETIMYPTPINSSPSVLPNAQ